MANDKRGDLKKYFSANMIPTESNFHELIDEIVLSSNGLEKLKDEPLKIAAGDGKNKVLSLHQKLDDGAKWSLSLNSGDRPGLSIDEKSGTSLLFIDESTRNVGIGVISIIDGAPDGSLHVKGNVYIDGDLYVKKDAYKKEEGAWRKNTVTFSDIRLKKDVNSLSNSLNKLLQLRGVNYKWKEPLLFGGSASEQTGFIAQEVEEVFPEWIYEQKINGENFKLLEINGLGFQALTVEAIKELHAICRKPERENLTISQSLNISGIIRAAQGTEKGLLFLDEEGMASAWMRCAKKDATNVLEIGASGDIKLTAGGTLTIGDSAGKHLAFGSDQITARIVGVSSGTLSLQKEGGSTELGGDLTVSGKTSFKNSIEITGALCVIGDAVFGLNENNKRFIFHSRTNGNGDFMQITHDNANGGWEWGQGVTIRRGGNVGVGTTNPSAKLHVAGLLRADSTLQVIGDAVFGLNENNKRFIFHSRTNGNGDFMQITHDSANGGWEWGQGVTIRRGGNIGVGTTNPSAKLHVAGDIKVDGFIYGRMASPSDERLKKEINTLTGSLGKLINLRGVSYKWKNPLIFGGSEEEQTGFIAQEVEKVFPQWIYRQIIKGDEYKLLEINGLGFQALTVEAIKELEARLKVSETSIKMFEEKIEAGLSAIGSALVDLQLRQLQQNDRIRKIEQKLGGN